MFGFGKSDPKERCAVIIDIGSGSVGVAIIKSVIGENSPEIIWTHREHSLIRDVSDLSETIKHITTSLINSFLELSSSGSKALEAYDPSLKITHIQTAISAPWSYTVTKTVRMTDEHPFDIEEDLVEELIKTAEKQAVTAVKETGLAEHELELITDATINLSVNGYNVSHVLDKKGRTLAISHTSVLAQSRILKTLTESTQKLFPKVTTATSSFMYTFFCMLKDMHPDTSEVCLVDITSEATEIGIIRDGILKHVTHAPYGTFTLAREIANACNIPKEEAYTYIKDSASLINKNLSVQNHDQINAIISAYELKISTLFKQTGDVLSIPKTLFLHTDNKTEDFFKTHIKQAAEISTHVDHSIHIITAKLLAETKINDTALLLSANFFHRDLHCDLQI